MAQGSWAYIQFIDRPGRPGGPVDPSWGIEEGGRPDQGLPPFQGYPGGGPVYPGRPIDPGYGRPGGGGEYPSTGPVRPGRPADPGYGIEEGSGEAGTLPIWPLGPEHGLPPIAGHPLPPIDPPPGTIWPPLPPSVPAGKVLVAVFISGVGHRYAVLTVPPVQPGHGLPNPPAAQPKG